MDLVIDVGGECGHAVRIGADLLARVPERFVDRGFGRGTRVLVVEDRNVAPHAAIVHAALASAGYATATLALDADEGRKSIEAVTAIWQAALRHRMSRRDLVVAIGGGLVGDVAGFAAATFLRGVAVVQIPTTLLAMVDASTGGKTGVNLPLPDGGLGKNMAGAFWPPKEVLVAPPVLATLSPRELCSGLAECVKHAIIDGEEHLAFLEAVVEPIRRSLDPVALADLIARSVRVKAGIVSRDARESGERAVLNLGHTVGHAIETDPAFALTHGEAVGLGILAILTAAAAEGRASPTLAQRIGRLLDRCGLPQRVEGGGAAGPILARMGYDKKRHGLGARFVIAEAPGRVVWDQTLSDAAIKAGLGAIGIT